MFSVSKIGRNKAGVISMYRYWCVSFHFYGDQRLPRSYPSFKIAILSAGFRTTKSTSRYFTLITAFDASTQLGYHAIYITTSTANIKPGDSRRSKCHTSSLAHCRPPPTARICPSNAATQQPATTLPVINL